MQVQQNICPHVVALGSFISSRQSVHFRSCFPCIHPIIVASFRSYLGMSPDSGVCAIDSIRLFDIAPGGTSSSAAPNIRVPSSVLSDLILSSVSLKCIQPCTTICITNNTPNTSYPTLCSPSGNLLVKIYRSPNTLLLRW